MRTAKASTRSPPDCDATIVQFSDSLTEPASVVSIESVAFQYLAATGAVAIVMGRGEARIVQAAAMDRHQQFYGVVDDLIWVSDRRVARRIVRTAKKRQQRDVRKTARSLGLKYAEHDKTIARAQETALELERGLRLARASGALSFFHQEYQTRRRNAAERGVRFMSFRRAEMRFRRVLIARLARDGAIDKTVVDEVFHAWD
ncbi:hypothetical protein [Bradyrhizobium paxllaeri]|uniref:hypothetical protein n=1 Tax=Bradyrhizobium paxllaeri TaxID=190148 RepID=UPI0011470DDD|nr:hypothetical protein [Bradyrhizobium paxllaeri]